MRLHSTVCLAIALLLAAPSMSAARIRHYSSRLLDGGAFESAFASAVNRDGDLFLGVNLGTGSTLFGVDGPVRMLVKMSPTGNVVWTRTLPQIAFENLQYPAMNQAFAATPDGGVVLTGYFGGSVDFGGGTMTAASLDIFLVKYGPDGALQWQRKYGGNQIQAGVAVTTDGDDIIITGYNQLTVDFGGGVIRSNGASDIFLAKLDANAGHIWSRGLGAGGMQEGTALAVAGDHRIALVCRFTTGAIDFGSGSQLNLGGADILAAVFDGQGAHLWNKHVGTTDGEEAACAAFDPDGNVFLCGSIGGPTDLGGGVLTPPPLATGEGFIVSYDADGKHRWSFMIADSTRSHAAGLAADGLGNCFVMGYNQSVLEFGLDVILPSNLLMLGFESDGQPLGGAGYNGVSWLQAGLRVAAPGDRVLLSATATGAVDFGGGLLQPIQSDVALATLGAEQPPRVSITGLDARETSAGVELTWSVAGTEVLGDYSITRRIDGSGSAEVLRSAPAMTGNGVFIDRVPRHGHLHTYRLTVTTALGDEVVSTPVSLIVQPVIDALEQNAPNPFNPVTTFAYSLAAPARVSIVIYDTRGAVVARLEQGEKTAGRHKASWGGHNMRGEFVASGVYFYALEGVPGVGARKMVLLK